MYRIVDFCGYAVPPMHFEQDRVQLTKSITGRGPAAVKAYQREKNRTSLDVLLAWHGEGGLL
jgi:hypothetical protein